MEVTLVEFDGSLEDSLANSIVDICRLIGHIVTFLSPAGYYVTELLDDTYCYRLLVLYGVNCYEIRGLGDTEKESIKDFCENFYEHVITRGEGQALLQMNRSSYMVSYIDSKLSLRNIGSLYNQE